MKRVTKGILSAALVVLLVVGQCMPALAAASITFTGFSGGFEFKPGSEYTETDLFENFKGVMPGDVLTENITFTNAATDCDFINLYMRAEAHDEEDNPLSEKVAETETVATMTDFLSQLYMKVWNGEELIYEASPDELDGLKENKFLGVFYTGQTTTLKVELTVPKDLGNEYADRVGEVDWIFHVEAFNEDQLSVRKVWSDGNYMHALDKVVVNLLKDGVKDDSATLDQSNGWAYTFDGLVEGHTWTVEEDEVPEGYVVSYLTVGRMTTITNTKIGEDPSEPSTDPTDPDEPTTKPTDPSEPTKPTDPDEPTTKPSEPTKPTDPDEPTTKPSKPTTEPSEPTTKPTTPTKPSEPTTKPTTPTTPSEPTTKPSKPTTEPSEPTTKPTTPTTPSKPTTPTTPSKPTTPTTPSKPTTPIIPSKPTSPDTPDEPTTTPDTPDTPTTKPVTPDEPTTEPPKPITPDNPGEPLDITVVKKWSNLGLSEKPAAVTVTLYNGKDVYESVVLNEKNDWTYHWEDLDAKGNWQIVETNIPKGFTPSYSVSNDGTVTITNTRKLIQTGQINWPIAVLGGVGFTLIILGGVMLIVRRKRSIV